MRVSVITPSYRSGQWLRLCIASVADQGAEVEHIVQDAGSDDGTLDWLAADPRVRLCVEKDAGMYDAINRGLRRATGEICAYLNCDEQYLPGTLRLVTDFFAAHAEVEVIFGDVVMVDQEGLYLFHRKVQPPLLGHTWTCHLSTYSCGMFFRRRLVDGRGFYFDPGYRSGGDGEWMVRLLRAGVRMGALRRFTSAFTQTGVNLGQQSVWREEWRRLRNTAPTWMRLLAPAFVVQHRVRRLLDGSYGRRPFSFSLYTLASPDRRILREVSQPVVRPPR